MIGADDYSTETGLRVRLSSDVTGTTMQATAAEWELFVEQVKAGRYDNIAKKPNVPFIY